ncbi:MAG: DUF423 domain-containing protein [Bdellovibrionales bacterium]|nr:DUF423 domain-containing protein [Bdellovibrionales bacterium]
MIHFKIACALMAIGIGLGAFGAHGLQERVPARDLEVWHTAVFYHLVHALALLALCSSSLLVSWVSESSLRLVWNLIIMGVVLFSGSLYILVLTNQRWLGMITPLGGVTLIVAWAVLFFCLRPS